MDVAAFTRQLVDIESITGNEGRVGDFLYGELLRRGFLAEKIPVEGSRCNVFAVFSEQPRPAVVFSTHMDTVPPFIPSSEDASRVFGRGSCDAKGIIATQVVAAERLHQEGIHVGLLFLVGVVLLIVGLVRSRKPRTVVTPAGWYQDPHAQGAWRWWDGNAWTDRTG